MGERDHTIAAIASPSGPARRGIVRLSGSRSAELVRATVAGERPAFEPRAARALHDGFFDDGRGPQPVRVLWMRGPRSYTREDVAEFHLPGSGPLLARALQRLVELGAEPAAPGEFTRRAFLNGRLDLSQAEGVLALVGAESEEERRAAAALLGGGLERRTRALRESLLDLRALCEASLDFDESETGHVPLEELRTGLADVRAALDEALCWELRQMAPSAVPRIALVGARNAGKSSLWNALTGGSAIVSELAGTTRDALEALWDLGPLTCVLVDGPGSEAAPSGVEAKAQSLFARERRRADLELWVADASSAREQLVEARSACARARVLAWNKVDLPGAPAEPAPELVGRDLRWVPVSARRREGLAQLARAAARELGAERESLGPGSGGEIARVLFARHRSALVESGRRLDQGATLLADSMRLDLAAEAFRTALEALESLAGRTTGEDVLDRIFARFCVGK